MPKFLLDCQWTMTAQVTVEAASEAEAIQDMMDSSEMPDGDYLASSFTAQIAEDE